MTNSITWRWTDLPVSEEEIKQAESFLGIKLPPPLITLFKNANGGKPSKTRIFQGNEIYYIFDTLLNIKHDTQDSIYIIYDSVRNALKKNIIPFGIDPFGNIFCIYKEDKYNDHVYIYLHEEDKDKNFTYICSNLENFLESLK